MKGRPRSVHRLFWLLPAVLVSVDGVAETWVDPTRPPTAMVRAEPKQEMRPIGDWQLSMTRVSGGDGLAILNGSLVRVGQQVADAKVLTIAPDHVLLEQAGRRLRVDLVRPMTVKHRIRMERRQP